MEDKQHATTKNEKLKPHPKTQTNFLWHFLFCWEVPIILKGWKKEITEEDLYGPIKEYEAAALGDRLEQIWLEEEHFRKNPSLWRALIKQFGLEYSIYGLVYLPAELAYSILQPFLLRKLLDYYTVNQTEISKEQAYIYAGGLAACSFLRVFFFHWFLFETAVVGMKARIACSSLIYRRCLTLKRCTAEKMSLGQMINLLSNDLTRFDQVAPFLHYIWIAPIHVAVACYYIDVTLGHAATAGCSIILLCLFFQMFLLVQMGKLRSKIAVKTDHRIRLMNSIICGIEAIKMYTWEKPFAKLVELARRLEMTQIRTATHFRLQNVGFRIHLAKVCVFLSVLVAVQTNIPITSQFVFILTSLYESLKYTFVIFMPMGVMMLGETLISVRRIEKFLLHDYSKPSNLLRSLKCILKLNQEHEKTTPQVFLEDVYAKWDTSLSKDVLSGITMRVSSGELVGVMGAAGSGKSTLLHVILKEVEVMKGKVEVEGTISYSSQDPWIFSASIKQNIVFGQEFDSDKYLRVLRVCALERDLSLFPYGDQTLVGERGVMLSGGQKARINLARAVYRDADVYLLDDPLSAVDANVALHIFDECIMEYLKHKCVILVTHQIHYLQEADKIYQIEMGQVVKKGTYQEVVGLKDTPKDCIKSEVAVVPLQKHELQREVKEHRSTGTTNRKIYKAYFLAAGHCVFTFFVVVLFSFGQVSVSLQDTFLTFWTNVEQEPENEVNAFFTTENCFYIYSALTALSVVVIHVACGSFTSYCMNASKSLHDNMLLKIVHGTMTFFNHHSSGRLLNRFSKDLGCIDELLPMTLMCVFTVILTGIATFFMINILNYWMVVPSILLISITIFGSIVFQPTNRNVKRTEGITKSSVFTHMSATLQGLTTIRAHDSQRTLSQEFDNHQDMHTSAFYLFTAIFAAFGFWADFMSAAYTILVIFSFFLLGSGTQVGNVGLAITQSINLMGMIQYGMKMWGELDGQMASVERVVEYAELNPEPDEGDGTPPEAWPTAGSVSFHSVSLRFSPEDPPVLKKVSFEVNSGEKIGIVGRTGAGKTSLISVLFRLFQFDGFVTIDNVDIKSIPLNALRSKISIIPQEPILFLGSVRKNIDPFDEFSDNQLWKVLEELELKQKIGNLPSGLESMVSERGSNFSVGERQLLCLVRAMLRNTKIIVLDEATANVDLKTDELIQSIIRRKFRECTVLTIAHRLNTIIDSDKILAMDGGMVVEFDQPYELLQNQNGFFFGLVKSTGDKILEEFTKIAKVKRKTGA